MIANTKIFNVLETFDRKELNRLDKFVHSPYFNANESVCVLFSTLKRLIVSKSQPETTREMVWDSIYPDIAFNDLRFRKLCTDLLRLVETFLSQQVYEENPLYQASYLVEAVSRKHLEVLYNSVMTTARRLSKRQLEKSASYYYYQYQIERYYYDISESEIKREDRSNLEEINSNLDSFYFSEKLRYYCTGLSQRKFHTQEYDIPFIDHILQHVEKGEYEESPHIIMYYHMYKMYTDSEDESSYKKLKELIFEYIAIFPLAEAHDIINAAINFCIQRLNQGEKQYQHEVYELYKYALAKDLIYVHNEITPSTFRNIVVVALRLKSFDWAEYFIDEFGSKVNSKYRLNTITFNKSQLFFYKKDYEKVLELLREVEYEDISTNLQAKSILMATYYELDEYDPLGSLLDSFKTYLNRKKGKIPAGRKEYYTNLVRFVKKLINTSISDKEGLKKLKTQISEESSVASKAWLLEKLGELGV